MSSRWRCADGAETGVEQARTAAEQARTAIDRDAPPEAWAAASAAVAITGRGFLPGHDNPWVHEVRADVADLRLRALERSRAMRARPYVARAQAGLAAALRRLGEAARANVLAGEAAATARELGMLRLQRELAVPSLS